MTPYSYLTFLHVCFSFYANVLPTSGLCAAEGHLKDKQYCCKDCFCNKTTRTVEHMKGLMFFSHNDLSFLFFISFSFISTNSIKLIDRKGRYTVYCVRPYASHVIAVSMWSIDPVCPLWLCSFYRGFTPISVCVCAHVCGGDSSGSMANEELITWRTSHAVENTLSW